MVAHDIRGVLSSVPELTITSSTTAEEVGAAFPQFASFNDGGITVGRFSGQTPWEYHDADELLHVLDGAVEVTLLTDGGSVHVTVRAGSIFVVPRGLWHRQLPRPVVTVLSAIPSEHGDVSSAEDPRRED